MSVLGMKKSSGARQSSSSSAAVEVDCSSISALVESLNSAVQNGDSDAISRCLYPPISESSLDKLNFDDRSARKSVTKGCDGVFVDIYDRRMAAMKEYENGNFVEAFKSEKEVTRLMTDKYKEKHEFKTLLLASIKKSLKANASYALKADEAKEKDNAEYYRNDYFRFLLQEIYNKKASFANQHQTLYSLALQNICCGYSFAANTVAVWYREDTDRVYHHIRDPSNGFAVNEVCHFAFNCGRYKMLSENYEDSVKWLQLAYDCSNRKNKFLILALLIPMQMCNNRMPSADVKNFGHKDMYELSLAIRQGNLREFEEKMQRHQRTFIKLGIYLALEKLKMVAYRNFFRRLRFAYAANASCNNIVLETQILPILQYYIPAMSLGELECILTNLIFDEWIKGNLGTNKDSKRMLVLKPKDKAKPDDAAFPFEKMKIRN